MLLRRLLRWAAHCVALGRMVIRSTRGGAPYPHPAVGVGARGDTGAGGAGSGLASRAGGRRLLRCRVGGLYPGATGYFASTHRAAQDEAGWAGNFRPGGICARRSHRSARPVTEQSRRSMPHLAATTSGADSVFPLPSTPCASSYSGARRGHLRWASALATTATNVLALSASEATILQTLIAVEEWWSKRLLCCSEIMPLAYRRCYTLYALAVQLLLLSCRIKCRLFS